MPATKTVEPTPSPGTLGFHTGISNEAYHSGPGVSKSGLWTIYSKTPAHFKYPPEKEMTTAKQANLDFGSALHIAILEPETFEARVMKGPYDRRGNKWTDAVAFANNTGKLLLVGSAYDEVQTVRDAIHANARINSIITGGKPVVEASGYWIDPETGLLCKFRPDHYREDIGVSLDLKSAESAAPDRFSRAVIDYGYHAQEAWYSDGFTALNKPLNGFLFLAVEKESPYAFKLHELPPSIVEEGRAAIRKGLYAYAECQRTEQWTAYGDDVAELKFPRWAYKNTPAPEAATDDYA